MYRSEDNFRLFRALFSSLGLMVFSFFIHSPFPAWIISFVALAGVAVLISRDLKSPDDLKKITGEGNHNRRFLFFLFAGLIYGTFLSLFYRWYLETAYIPSSVHWFALVAAMIGSTEELVFRGYVQGQFARKAGLYSILAGSLAHTGYKCCLFLNPAVSGSVDIIFLVFWTFIAGLLLGILRHFSRSLWPAVVAHALFDILVYGEKLIAPWWVW